jgi:hypothetical protein
VSKETYNSGRRRGRSEEGKVQMLMPVFITYRMMLVPVFERITKNSAPG